MRRVAPPLTEPGRAPSGRPRRAPRLRAFVPRLPRAVWILQGGAFANALGSGLVFPFVLIYLRDVRGFTLGVAGLVVGTFGLFGIVATPFAGMLVDRLGARAVLRGSLLVLALGYGALPLVRVPWEAFLCMAIAGLGNGGFWPSQSSLIMGLAPPDLRHQVSAVGRTVYNLGLGLGAALGGLIVAGATSSHFTVLFVFDALTFVAFAAVTTLVPAHGDERVGAAAAAPEQPREGYRAVFRDRIFLCVIGLNVVYVTAAFAPFETTMPLFARNDLGLSPRAIGLVFLVNMFGVAVLQLPAAKAIEGRRRMAALAAMTVAFASAFVLIAGADSLRGLSALGILAIAALVFAAGECVQGPAQGPLVVDLAPPALRGRYMALLTNSYAVGFAIGPPIAALVLGVSPRGLWLLAGAVVLCAGAGALVLERRIPEALRRTPVSSG